MISSGNLLSYRSVMMSVPDSLARFRAPSRNEVDLEGGCGWKKLGFLGLPRIFSNYYLDLILKDT